MTLSIYGPRLPVYDHEALRHAMVDGLRDIQDGRVLQAMRRVPRHLFAPEALHTRAYEPTSIPIGYGQSLAEPRVVAALLQAAALQGHERVLEVGVCSGYETALLSILADEVYALEVIPGLARIAKHNLAQADFGRARVVHGDAGVGWPAAAPYDLILVSGAASSVPEPLLEQLGDNGRIVFPVGPGPLRSVRRVTRTGSSFDTIELALPARSASEVV